MAGELKRSSTSGHLLQCPDGHLRLTCCGVDCSINCATMPTAITVNVAALTVACPDCGPSGSPAWLGDLAYGFGCLWTAAAYGFGVTRSINGMFLAGQYTGLTLINPGLSAPCFWRLEIRCDLTGSDQPLGLPDGGVVWQGTKLTGSTPLGVYTRTSGCDLAATLTVS